MGDAKIELWISPKLLREESEETVVKLLQLEVRDAVRGLKASA